MEHPEIFGELVAILGIGFVALLCDFLRWKDWQLASSLGSQPMKRVVSSPIEPKRPTSPQALAVIAKGAARADRESSELPRGLQNAAMLERLIGRSQKVSGFIVIVRTSEVVVPSLIGPQDFAAPLGDGEFLLIYSQHRGALLGSDGVSARNQPIQQAIELARAVHVR